jgi:hypothetical protein
VITTALERASATYRLLICGAVAGPLWLAISFAQAILRDGFDLRRHALSNLALGSYGWLQVANFAVCGVLMIAFAVGVRRVLVSGPGRRILPVLFGLVGVGMIAGGVFVPDAAYGFPAGAPDSLPDVMSTHALLHVVAGLTVFGSLTVGCLVFAWRSGHARRWGWAAYSVATAVASQVPAIAVDINSAEASMWLAGAAVCIWAWVTAVALHLRATNWIRTAPPRRWGRPRFAGYSE